jgi:hypothetical protein
MVLRFAAAVKAALRPMVRRARRSIKHKQLLREIHQILNAIRLSSGKTLDERDKRLCDEYAEAVLKDKIFAPWLYVYTTIAGAFKPGWIPDNYYGSVVKPNINGFYGALSGLKPLNQMVFQSDSFPDALSFVNGVFFRGNGNFVPEDQITSVLFNGVDRVVFKLDRSCSGCGVYVFDRSSFMLEKVKLLGNGLFQPFIHQHAFFQEFVSGPVATLRLTTISADDGAAVARAAYLRLGRAGDSVVQSENQVRISVDLGTGALDHVGYTSDWRAVRAHPDSGVSFAKKLVPNFEGCVKLVTNLHRRVPYVRCIGWDLVIDKHGMVKIMEWNGGHNDIKFSEATQGPCFAELGWERFAGHPKRP